MKINKITINRDRQFELRFRYSSMVSGVAAKRRNDLADSFDQFMANADQSQRDKWGESLLKGESIWITRVDGGETYQFRTHQLVIESESIPLVKMRYTVDSLEQIIEPIGEEFSRLWSEALKKNDRQTLKRLFDVAQSFGSVGDEAYDDEILSEQLCEMSLDE